MMRALSLGPAGMFAAAAMVLAACSPAPPAPASTGAAPSATGAAAPTSLEGLATYTGADRQAILEAGARTEGTVTWYTTTIKESLGDPLINAFQEKYPYIKVDYFRATPEDLGRRYLQEMQASHYTADVVEQSLPNLQDLVDADSFQPFHSPSADSIPGDVKSPNACTICTWIQTWQLYPTITYNTTSISADNAPKTWDDLLQPQWKDKMTMSPSGSATDWVGMIYQTRGEDFLKKLAAQNIKVQGGSSTALIAQVVSGEVPLSPLLYTKDVEAQQAKGAPIADVIVSPIVPITSTLELARHAPHPYSALLLLDFILSTDQGGGQQITLSTGYGSAALGEGGRRYDLKNMALDSNYADERQQWQDLFDKYMVHGGN